MFSTARIASSDRETELEYVRDPRGAPWPAGVGVAATGMPGRGEPGYLSADGLTLFVGYAFQTYSATRANKLATFGSLSSVPGVNTATTAYFTEEASTNADGSHLFAASNRDTGTWLYEATFAGGGAYNTPAKIAELASPQGETAPISSGDALTLYFASGRGGVGPHVYVATRPNLSSPFVGVTPVAEVNAGAGVVDYPAWLSPDSCRLYTLSTRAAVAAGSFEVYVATKPK